MVEFHWVGSVSPSILDNLQQLDQEDINKKNYESAYLEFVYQLIHSYNIQGEAFQAYISNKP